MRKRTNERSGFTLMEVSLTVGILVILLTITLSISQNALRRSGLRMAENVIIQTLRRAQVLSQNNVDGFQWGVYICSGEPVAMGCTGRASIVLYKRDDFENQIADDQTFEINPNIEFKGDLFFLMTDNDSTPPRKGVTFQRFTGEPTFDGSITFEVGSEIRKVTMNNKGVVERY